MNRSRRLRKLGIGSPLIDRGDYRRPSMTSRLDLQRHPMKCPSSNPPFRHDFCVKATQPVTPACLWRGSRYLKRPGFQPEARGNDDFRLSCFVVTGPGHGHWPESGKTTWIPAFAGMSAPGIWTPIGVEWYEVEIPALSGDEEAMPAGSLHCMLVEKKTIRPTHASPAND
jgi:hypothetical protein